MEDNQSYLPEQADQLRKWSAEIDELKANQDKTKAESKRALRKQQGELRMKIETARDNLIRVFFAIRNQDHSE
jgi:hypothetical protein